MEGDDKTTNVLNSPENGRISVLQEVRMQANGELEVYSPWPRK